MKPSIRLISYLIVLAIIANAIGLFFPVLRSTYGPYYGSIAKHIVISGNWYNLVLANNDWLDKPHLPFWLTAFSYKIFGINSFAYIFPGFLSNLLGLYFTYKLARIWYGRDTALLAVLFTLTSFHIMLSAIDVRAEAYLLPEVVGACYFWLLYDKCGSIKYLILGAVFTALALMTKGIFILITISSGIICLWFYSGQLKNCIRPKWLVAIILTFLLIFPELLSLYTQFDMHPDKVIYGHTHVSGIKWFFWGSQFGRFLGTGPIHSSDSSAWHYLFFIHTMLWAYLPWWPIFFTAIYSYIVDKIRNKSKNVNTEFLIAKRFNLAAFFVTFILFSVSTFQVDHYTNILFPFASIISASYIISVFNQLPSSVKPKLSYVMSILSVLLLLLVLIIAPYILSGNYLYLVILFDIIAWVVIIYYRHKNWLFQIVLLPTLAIIAVFMLVIGVNGIEYAKYDGGYQLANYLNQKSNIEVASYNVSSANQIDMLDLDLHSDNKYNILKSLEQIKHIAKPLYLVVEPKDINNVMQYYPNSLVVYSVQACTIEIFMRYILDQQELINQLHKYVVIKINR